MTPAPRRVRLPPTPHRGPYRHNSTFAPAANGGEGGVLAPARANRDASARRPVTAMDQFLGRRR